MRSFGMVACALALMAGGCASGPAFDHIRANYSGKPLASHTYKDREFRVIDKPEAASLVISPTIAEATGQGIVYGATVGAADQSTFTKPYADAAADYLAGTGRACRVLSTELLVRPLYEVKYDCSSAAQTPAAKRR